MSMGIPPNDPQSSIPYTGLARYRVSVVEPVGMAFEWMKRVLFPFNFMRWLTFSVPLFLLQCGEGGGGTNFNLPGGGGGGPGGGGMKDFAQQALDQIGSNTGLIIGFAVGAYVVILLITAIIQFIASRGQFIFLENMLTGEPGVSESWGRLAKPANSHFFFVFLLNALFTLIVIATLAVGAMTVLNILAGNLEFSSALPGMFLLGAPLILIGLATGIVMLLVNDLAVPLMYRRGYTIWYALGLIRSLVFNNIGTFTIYVLFRILISIVIGLIQGLIGLALCCTGVGLCILVIPVVNVMPFLPLFAFRRLYTVMFLEQFGPDWEIFDRRGLGTPNYR